MNSSISISRISVLPQNIGVFSSENARSIWQTIAWNKFLLKTGYESEGFVIWNDSIGGIFEKRSVGFGQFGLFCLGGPVVSEDVSNIELDNWVKAVEVFAKTEWVLFVQIEPLVQIHFPRFQEGSYKKFIEPYTIVLDLQVSEEEILSQMKEKGRYNIRLAQKRGVTAALVEPTEENLQIFLDLFEETLSRDGFAGNSRAYYKEMLEYLTTENLWGLFIARNASGIPVAASIAVFYWKDAYYYYGASSSDSVLRRDMGAYLIQWEMILEARRRGCETYDFLGIAPEGSVWHHLEWVTDFKKKFGWRIIAWPDAQIIIIQPLWYRILQFAKTIKKLIRR